jgi:hypothetical protein
MRWQLIRPCADVEHAFEVKLSAGDFYNFFEDNSETHEELPSKEMIAAMAEVKLGKLSSVGHIQQLMVEKKPEAEKEPSADDHEVEIDD